MGRKKEPKAELVKVVVTYTCDGVETSAVVGEECWTCYSDPCDLCGSHEAVKVGFICSVCKSHHTLTVMSD